MRKLAKLLIGSLIGIFVIAFGLAGSVVFGDDSMYYLLLMTGRAKRAVHNYVLNDSVEKEKGIHSEVTTGTGLNLLLIDELKEGYCKEMLTLFRDSSEGKLDGAGVHASLTTFCGMQANETGFYSGTHLLKSYLPYENGAVVWKEAWKGIAAEKMSLYKVDKGVYADGLPNNGIDGSGGETVFQFDPAMPKNAAHKSSLNGATNGGRKEADNKFLPDILAAVNYHLTDNADVAQISSQWSSMDGDSIASFTSAQHNRGGAGAVQYAFGVNYGISASSKLNILSQNGSEIVNAMKPLRDLCVNYKDGVLKEDASIDSDIFLDSGSGRYIAVCLAAKAEGWYVSSDAVSYCGNSKGMEIWNKLYPDDKVSSVDDLKKRFSSSSCTLVQAIKNTTGDTVSADDTGRVYGTTSDYDDCSYSGAWSHCGFIFHVSKSTSSVYKEQYSGGKAPYLVACYDIIAGGHNVGTVIGGSYVYAYMLRLGGLTSVDPTKPSTYNGSLKEETFVAGANTDWMDAYNVDKSKLTPDRINVLNTAKNLTEIGCKYEQNGTLMDAEWKEDIIPTKLDCTGFVTRVFFSSGFGNTRRYTGTIISEDIFVCIPKDDAKPGDIFSCHGTDNAHAVMYLSGPLGDYANFWVIHSTSDRWGDPDGPAFKMYTAAWHPITNSTNCNITGGTMYCFKFRKIDTGEVKTQVWTKEGKHYLNK